MMNADDWDRRYAARPERWSRGPMATLVREVEALEPGRALDLACGDGRNAIWLASVGWRVRAVDFSRVALELGRERAAALGLDVDWVQADVTRVHEPPAYDLVIVIYLHTPAQQRAAWLGAARDALRPGGTLVYLGHDVSNLEHGHGGPRSRDVLCSPEDIVAGLTGLRIERATVLERPIEAEPGHGPPSDGATARDALVRAVRE